MNKLQLIYNKLYNAFGPQGWWPLTISGYKTMHHSGDPRNDRHRLEIIIGAILTQNTSWKNVEKALENLSKNKLMSIKRIKKISQKKLANLIKSSGYYNQKAERLKIMADFLSKNKISGLKKEKNIKKLREKLLNVKGIGPETADSIILYAFQKPIFVIDAYTKRIFERLGFKEKTYEQLQKLFMDNLEKNHKIFNEYHALLVELGKSYCGKTPACIECPLNEMCKNKKL